MRLLVNLHGVDIIKTRSYKTKEQLEKRKQQLQAFFYHLSGGHREEIPKDRQSKKVPFEQSKFVHNPLNITEVA